MNKIILLLFILTMSCNQQNKSGSSGAVELKNDDMKSFYAIGAMFGGRLANLSLNSEEVAAVQMGIADSASGKKLKVDAKAYQMKVQALFKNRLTKHAGTVKKAGEAYLNKFISNGATKTKSGLAYKIEKPGKGKKPTATELVKVHYRGTLLDGKEFDSSYKRGQPVTFPLNRVIKGWTEGLQLIAPGGKIKLVIPSDLAYGDAGHPPTIPGGATLVFDVELLSIEKQPAAQAAPKSHSKMKKKHSKSKKHTK